MATRLGLYAAVALLVHGSAYGSCSAEEATAKAERLAKKIEEITQNDPQRAAQLREELQVITPQTSALDLQDSCAGYDQRLQELEQVDEEVEAAND